MTDIAHTIRVLLLEDSAPEARHIQQILARAPGARYLVDHVDRLAPLLGKLATGSYDVALIDLCVPDSEGLPTLARVREAAPRLPIVVQSGLEEESLAIEAVRLGAQDYIVKDDLDARILPRALRYAIERWRSEEALRDSEERYALAVQGANDGLWDWDVRTGAVHYSARWMEMLGGGGDAVVGRPEEWLERVHPEDVDALGLGLKRHLDGLSPCLEHEYRIRHADGAWRWVLCRGLAVRDARGQPYRMAGSQTDVTARREMEDRLVHEAFHDVLTGLPNRALFLDRLEQAVRRAKRATHRFAVLFLDLDRFKLVNDSLGHVVGDRLLVEVAQRIAGCLRPGDTVARLGGDEFAILLEQMPHCDDAQRTAERIQASLRVPVVVDGHELFCTASIGILCDVNGYDRPEDLLRDADAAMYRAKSAGRARHEVFDRRLHASAVARLELESELRRAIDKGELVVHYQPIVSLAKGHTVRFEALLRWNSPSRGLVAPGEFVPVLEETGLIVPVGLWVVEEVCRQIRAWRDDGAFGGQPMTVGVNVSTRQFARADFVESIAAVIERTGVPPRCLALEITESLLMENPGAAAEMLGRLRRLGLSIDLDDFGTGYSSLSYLQRFPIDTLKIDRSFVNGMATSRGDVEIVRAIIALARGLGMSVVAEGIETLEQLGYLRDLHCELGQGFLFARPGPALHGGVHGGMAMAAH